MNPQPVTGFGVEPGSVPAPAPTRSAVAWPVAAVVAGISGLALAFAPFGPVGVVLGGAGIVTGCIGVRCFRCGRAMLALALVGLVASVLAVPVGLVTLFPRRTPPPPAVAAPPAPKEHFPLFNENLTDVLANVIDVKFGSYQSAAADGSDPPGVGAPGVSITVTNRGDFPRRVFFDVGAFGANGEQIASQGELGVLLGGHCTQQIQAFSRAQDPDTAQQLVAADFRVIKVKAGTPFAPF